MKVSVITVVRNNAHLIRNCIESVLSQTYPLEYIIIDGNSTDGTLEIIREYRSKIAQIVSAPDEGIYDAMNKGIALATGDVIGILNSDDVYADSTVLERVATVFSNKSIDACYGDLVYVERNNLNRVVRYWKSRTYEQGLFGKCWVPPHPTFYVRRSIIEQYGRFDLNYSLAGDFELMLRFMARYNIRTVYIPHVLIKMRVGGSTNKNIGNIIKQNNEIYQAGIKNGIPISYISIMNKFILRMMQFMSRPPSSANHE